MDRRKVILKLNDTILENTKQQNIELAKLIYEKYPELVSEKPSGLEIRIKEIPTEFLQKILNDSKTIPFYLQM